MEDFRFYAEAHSSVAQLVEQAAVNRWVVGSSPTRGAFPVVPVGLRTPNTHFRLANVRWFTFPIVPSAPRCAHSKSSRVGCGRDPQ